MATIPHDFPSDLRQADILHQFDFFSASRGLVPEQRRVVLVGIQGSGATATANEPIQVFDDTDADTKFDKGSELALMCRKAFEVATLVGTSAEIWGLPLADPSGTAQSSTLTVAGTATESGNIIIKLAGRTVVVPVANGDTSAVVAASIESKFDELFETGIMPSTAGVAASVVTLTSTWTGLSAADIGDPTIEQDVAGITVTPANVTTGATVVSLATPLDSLLDKRYHAIAIAQHDTASFGELDTHLDEAWTKRLWGFGYAGEHGTLGTATTLASGVDIYHNVVVACEDCPNMESESAAAFAAAVESKSQPNFNFDSFELPLFLPPASSVFTSGAGGEIETALAGGVSPLIPTDQGNNLKIVRAVTTQTTFNSAPTEVVKDLANPRTVAFMAFQLDTGLRTKFPAANLEGPNGQDTLDQIIDVVFDILKEAEVLKILKNVDEHFNELIAEIDTTTPTRAVVTAPESVVQNLHQIVVVHRLFVE